MKSKADRRVVIQEWDGDRSSELGGFTVIVEIKGESFDCPIGAYDNSSERRKIQRAASRKAKKVAAALNCEVVKEGL